MSYWDASALVKLYVEEPDSGWFEELSRRPGEQITTSSIAESEVLCTLYRKEREEKSGVARLMFERFLADIRIGKVDIVPYGRDILAQAERLVRMAFHRRRPVMIRSLDAIHVASALVSKAPLVVATDTRLRDRAALAGLGWSTESVLLVSFWFGRDAARC